MLAHSWLARGHPKCRACRICTQSHRSNTCDW